MEITITEAKRAGVLVLELAGTVHGGNAEEFEDGLLDRIAAGERLFLLDCTRLEYVSSAGVRSLMVLARRLREVGGKMAMCGVNRNVSDILDISGLDSVFGVYDSEEEAMRSLVS